MRISIPLDFLFDSYTLLLTGLGVPVKPQIYIVLIQAGVKIHCPSYIVKLLLFFFFFLYFFPSIFISWRLITLQYCSVFCHTLTWISHGFTCVPHPNPRSRLPLHPIPLGLPSPPALSTLKLVLETQRQPLTFIPVHFSFIQLIIPFIHSKHLEGQVLCQGWDTKTAP